MLLKKETSAGIRSFFKFFEIFAEKCRIRHFEVDSFCFALIFVLYSRNCFVIFQGIMLPKFEKKARRIKLV